MLRTGRSQWFDGHRYGFFRPVAAPYAHHSGAECNATAARDRIFLQWGLRHSRAAGGHLYNHLRSSRLQTADIRRGEAGDRANAHSQRDAAGGGTRGASAGFYQLRADRQKL